MLKKIDFKKVYLVTLIVSLLSSRISINLGFSVKPFMIVTLVGFLCNISDFIKKESYEIFKKKYEITLLVFFLLYSFSIFQSVVVYQSVRMIMGLGLITLFYIANRIILLKINILSYIDSILKALIIMVVINLLIYLISAVKLNFNFSIGNGLHLGMLIDRGNPRLIGLSSFDPNISFFQMTPLIFLSLNCIKKGKAKLLLFLTSIMMILTMSRGGMLGLMISLVIYFTFFDKILIESLNKIYYKYSPIVFFCTVALFITICVLIFMQTNMYHRFLLLFKDGGSGRIELIEIGLKNFKENPVYGVGLYNSVFLYYKDYSSKFFLHNTHLEVLVESGIIGFSGYILFIYNYLREFVKNRSGNRAMLFVIGTLISLVIQMTFLSLILNEMFYFILIIGVTFIQTSEGEYI